MPRQEMLCWTSLVVSVSILFFYVIFVFGWPEFLPDYSEQAVKIFFNLFWIAFVIELIIGITEKKNRPDKDERDIWIESQGIRFAYYLLVTFLVVLLGHFFFNMLFEGSDIHSTLLIQNSTMFHVLFLMLLSASISKRIIMLYHYRKDEFDE